MQKTKLIFASALAIFGMAFFVPAQAEEAPIVPPELQGPTVAQPVQIEGTVDCFDYYKFGSVQVDVEAETASTVSGVPLSMRATLKNENSYPIVEGAVYAKVFRAQTDEDKAHSNGNFLVDQFFVQDGISLPADGQKVIDFQWSVPNYASSGEYQVAMFFTSAKKFNLLGLSFTDDVVGNVFNFSVVGEVEQNVEFDKNAVDINGSNYHFAAFPPRFKDEDIRIKTELVNPTDKTQAIPVTYKLYSWDAQTEENLIGTKTETIELNPKETKQLEYVIQDKTSPVYYLVAEARYQDTKSILDIRVVRENANKVRINFPSITNYPLKQNESNTIFVCAHNSGTADVIDNNKLVVSILDENKKQIHQYAYTGQISGAMMGLKEDFTPKKNYATFYIKSELYTDDKLVDSAMMEYDCQELGPAACPGPATGAIAEDSAGGQEENPYLKAIAIAIIALTIGGSLIAIIIKRKRPYVNLLILGFVLASLLFGGAGEAEAKSVVWNTTVNQNLWYYWNWYKNTTSPVCHTNSLLSGFSTTYGGLCVFTFPIANSSGWAPGLSNPNISIAYNAQIVNADTGVLLGSGSIVSVGTRIRLEKIAHKNTDISWFGAGYSSDSPYGVFSNNATAPNETCDDNFFTNKYCTSGYCFNVYVPLSINPPAISFTHSGTAGLSCDVTGSLCTVDSPGTISANIIFGNTYGKFYYRYYDINRGGGCKYNSVPMELQNSNSAYQLSVPAQTISYNLTAVSSNNPPTVPTLTGPATGTTDAVYNFTARATDPNNDTLRYGFDWDNNNVVDQWMPGTGFVASGTAQVAARQWPTVGAKTFKVNACDSKGGCSAWSAPFTIAISAPALPPDPCASITPIEGRCGTADGGTFMDSPPASPSGILCSSGNPSAVSGTDDSWDWTCNGICSTTNVSCSAKRSLDLNWKEVNPN